jgi:hypothetical protein
MKKKHIIKFILPFFILTACSAPAPSPTPDIAGTAVVIAETVVAERLEATDQVLETTAASATETPVLSPTATPTPLPPADQVTPFPTDQEIATGLCLHASLVSETIEDDTIIEAGTSFEKSWTLRNTGTCHWTEEFSFIFHHGETMAGTTRAALPGQVAPGEAFTFTQNLVAPSAPGSHIGFWILESANGTQFGNGQSGSIPFWVRITVPGPQPTAQAHNIAVSSGGSVRSDGATDNTIIVGDNSKDQAQQAFITFSLGNIPSDAIVTAVTFSLAEGGLRNGSPFTSLGCLNIIPHNYGNIDASDFSAGTGAALWRFCDIVSFESAIARGDQNAIDILQDAVTANFIQFRLQFDYETNSNATPDYLMPYPVLRIEWYKP